MLHDIEETIPDQGGRGATENSLAQTYSTAISKFFAIRILYHDEVHDD